MRALPQLRHLTTWVYAGHSMGGRVACELASCSASSSEDGCGNSNKDGDGSGNHALASAQSTSSCCAACLFLSYPVHPPGKPVRNTSFAKNEEVANCIVAKVLQAEVPEVYPFEPRSFSSAHLDCCCRWYHARVCYRPDRPPALHPPRLRTSCETRR